MLENQKEPGETDSPSERAARASLTRLDVPGRKPLRRETLRTPKFLGLAAGIAAVAAMGGGFLATQGSASVASAASANSGASVVQAAASTTDAGPNAADHQAATADFIAKLATRLGIDETTLKADLTQTSLDELSAQVSAGTLTQAQADQITTSIKNGDNYFFGVGGPGGRGGPGGPAGMRGGPGGFIGHDSAALASFLGIDQATLQSDVQGGQTLATVATAQGKTRDQLNTFLTDEMTTQLKAQVSAGTLTQAQSDDMLSHFTANLDAMIDGTMPQRGPGGPSNGAAPSTGSSSGTTTTTS
jgi:hypothetical protein